MAHINKLYQVIDHDSLDSEYPKMRPLNRGAAEETLILDCVRPLAASNIRVYASDASTLKGGLVATEVGSGCQVHFGGQKRQKITNCKAARMPFTESIILFAEEEGAHGLVRRKRSLVPLASTMTLLSCVEQQGVVTAELVKLGLRCGPVFSRVVHGNCMAFSRGGLLLVASSGGSPCSLHQKEFCFLTNSFSPILAKKCS